mmetsp:Transcript_21729/g.35866  ORF Transcript_21729/g.35866 Transcript_21729/m.35866 type:complete len:341 (+) Transcript_21729:82-1104(+)
MQMKRARAVVEPTTGKRNRAARKVADEPSCSAASPFAQHGPIEQEIRTVHHALSFLHPEVVAEARTQPEDKKQAGCGSRHLVLDALVGTILSQNTTDVNSHRAFASLKSLFTDWEAVRRSPPAPIEDAIRSGGLAAIKTARIQAILNSLKAEHGKCCLEFLRSETDEEVKRILRTYKGVGAKTISCVLMFCLKRKDFPVDTHVWKLAMNLGWVPKSASRDQTYDHLNMRVPDDIKYELHVLLVKHGKVHKNEVRVLRATMRELGGVSADESLPTRATGADVKAEAEAEVKTEVKTEAEAEAAVKVEAEAPVKVEDEAKEHTKMEGAKPKGGGKAKRTKAS